MDKIDSFYLPPNLAILVNEFRDGKKIGEPCGIDLMNDHFSWKRGFINTWTGWPNDGKTTFFLFMALVKSLRDKWKWCIWSPEMIGSHKDGNKISINANDIYDDLIFMKTGKTPYKHMAEKYFLKRMSLEEYIEEVEWMEEHFFVIYPEARKPDNIFDAFKFMYDKFGCDGFLGDPFKSFQLNEDGRTDLVLDELFFNAKKFAIQTDSTVNFIAHPKSLHEVKEKNGAYKVVTQSMLSGGASFDNNMDGIFSINRPGRHLNPNDPDVVFYNLKQRKQQLVGRRGSCDKIKFDFLWNRYFFDEVCPIDGSYSRAKQKEMQKQGAMDFKKQEQDEKIKDPNYQPF